MRVSCMREYKFVDFTKHLRVLFFRTTSLLKASLSTDTTVFSVARSRVPPSRAKNLFAVFSNVGGRFDSIGFDGGNETSEYCMKCAYNVLKSSCGWQESGPASFVWKAR